jgi:uncharacterized RDD family membrane protein YckC
MNTEFNPYSAPESAVGDVVTNQSGEVASRGMRFGTLLIDYLCFLVLSFLFGMLVFTLFGQAGAAALKKVPNFVLGTPMLLAFYCFFEGLWGRTPGKFLLGTRVVDARGEKPGFSQIVGRTLCRFIPFDAFSFFGEEGWHDSISKTQVVRTR